MTNKFDLSHEYPLFSAQFAEQMSTVRELCREECFYLGYTLFEDGEPATKMYVLVDGKIEVFFAIGGIPLTIPFPGIKETRLFLASDLLEGVKQVETSTVFVIGGELVGLSQELITIPAPILEGLIWDHFNPVYVFLISIAVDLLLKPPLLAAIPETLSKVAKEETDG